MWPYIFWIITHNWTDECRQTFIFKKKHNVLKQSVCDYTYFLCDHICLLKKHKIQKKKTIVSFNSVSEFNCRCTSNFDVQGWQNIFLTRFKNCIRQYCLQSGLWAITLNPNSLWSINLDPHLSSKLRQYFLKRV